MTATDTDVWICQVLMISVGKRSLFHNRVLTRFRTVTECLIEDKDNVIIKFGVFGFKYYTAHSVTFA